MWLMHSECFLGGRHAWSVGRTTTATVGTAYLLADYAGIRRVSTAPCSTCMNSGMVAWPKPSQSSCFAAVQDAAADGGLFMLRAPEHRRRVLGRDGAGGFPVPGGRRDVLLGQHSGHDRCAAVPKPPTLPPVLHHCCDNIAEDAWRRERTCALCTPLGLQFHSVGSLPAQACVSNLYRNNFHADGACLNRRACAL